MKAETEDWCLAALADFGLAGTDIMIIKSEADRMEFNFAGFNGLLRLTSIPPEELDAMMAWEALLSQRKMAGKRLLTGSGGGWTAVDEHTRAVLTVWEGADIHRLETLPGIAGVAQYLGVFRRLAETSAYRAPQAPGIGWGESLAKRAERLASFAVLAAERLNPTPFDLTYLEQANYFQKQAERGTTELQNSLARIEPGVALTEVDRHLFYSTSDGLALKSLLGLRVDAPIRDLYRLMARVLPRLDWSSETVGEILRSYAAAWPLSGAELAVLRAGLRFPHEHYRLSHHYFLNRKNWPLRTFLRKQEKVWRQEPLRTRVLEDLPLLLP